MDEFRTRPDPDRLLGEILEKEKKETRGRLKIFFGMAAGVGKTYAMLETAQRLKGEGKEIVVGYVETHGRKETDELAQGLALLPRKIIDHKGLLLDEFDLDAALASAPDYIIVDELAHTNADGSRHLKRYQDVEELLDHGINVFTTLNVQHLESQIDIVEKITGVKIRETLPDSVLDRADEVELVDIPTEELLKRLHEGKVYLPEKSAAAAENFFRETNITALRELALHYVAHVVGHNLSDIVQKKDLRGAWKEGEKILVAVSSSPYSEYLIRWTRRLAFAIKAQWIALYIESENELSEKAKELLQKNLTLARDLGAEVLYTSDEDIVAGVLRVAHQKNVTQIIIGKPLKRYVSDLFKGGNLVERILKRCGDIELHVVTQPDTARKRFFNPVSAAGFSPFREYLIAAETIFVATLLGHFIASFTGYWTIALIYLLCVAILALRVGKGPVLCSAALSAGLWNFLFIPPLYTFRISKIEDAMMFGTYFAIAIVLGGLTSKLRIKERALRKREARITDLYELSTLLDKARSTDEIASVAAVYIKRYLSMDAVIFFSDETGELKEQEHIENRIAVSGKDLGVVDWVFKNGIAAGIFTKTLPKSAAYFIPLRSPGSIVGVIGLRPEKMTLLDPELDSFIQNMVSQIAIHVEHEMLSETKRKVQLVTESEHLYKVLLNSVSHELRTPLTAITGASSGLMDPTIEENAQTRHALVSEIHKASGRLNRLVDNLLDMSRLESGMLTLNRKRYDIQDLVSVTVRRLGEELSAHTVSISVPDTIPQISIDFALMEQTIANLVYNAAAYTPAGSRIAIAAAASSSHVAITVSDNGPGLADDEIPYLFDKFRRGAHVPAGGTGLGLSICRGIVEAHGGKISAANSSDGGAVFTITLPLSDAEKGEK